MTAKVYMPIATIDMESLYPGTRILESAAKPSNTLVGEAYEKICLQRSQHTRPAIPDVFPIVHRKYAIWSDGKFTFTTKFI